MHLPLRLRPRAYKLRATLLVLCALTLAMGHSRALGEDTQRSERWRLTREDDGIRSWERASPQQPLPSYRARTMFDASVWEALAILDDVDRACEWTAHCAEMRRVQTLSEREVLVYARMDAPWPVRDRDATVRVQVVYGDVGELIVHIRGESAPAPTGHKAVVHMPRFIAHYRFQTRGERVEVEYQLELDPGGALPDWLKGLVAKQLAHDTLARLRDRVRWARDASTYRVRAQQLEAQAHNSGYRDDLRKGPSLATRAR
ncbi:MAG: hypothetical protein RLZZ450_2368 [Pseudomonadota bacterium]